MDLTYATISRIERFTKHISNNGSCWEWSAYTDRGGYGRFDSKAAHRFAYLLTGNELVDGMDIDHLCRNRKCVNPKHLEQVTRKENINRGDTGKHAGKHNANKEKCKSGHLFSKNNTYIYKTKLGHTLRQCKTCNRESHRLRYLNNK